MHKNHVHVFDKKKKKEVATINGLARNVTYQDLGLPTKLGELITEYAYTPIKERMADEISDDRTVILARDIRNQVEKALDYPGNIKITVIREKRVVAIAK